MTSNAPSSYFEGLFSLAGKTAVVTGGAMGIGRIIAEALVRSGADVIIASRKKDACEQCAAALNQLGARGSAHGMAGDIGTESGVSALAEQIGGRFPRLSILVNNAAATWGAPLESFPYAAWDKVFSVNVAGMFALTQRLLPQLSAAATADDPARIVNLGSVMGSQPMGDGAYSYSASKAAVHHLTRILAKEFASRRITVNALAPGLFETRMTAFATKDPTRVARLKQRIPLGRLGRPEDIASAILFLCGRGGAYVTGAILPVDGGVGVETGADLWGDEAYPPRPSGLHRHSALGYRSRTGPTIKK
jgi:NAD(P)-dependent dehydrogenase (short-subunit alcohol dehydrogenase family)